MLWTYYHFAPKAYTMAYFMDFSFTSIIYEINETLDNVLNTNQELARIRPSRFVKSLHYNPRLIL